jgi:hypothetical protein
VKDRMCVHMLAHKNSSGIMPCGVCHSVLKRRSQASCARPTPQGRNQHPTHRAMTSCCRMCASVLYADAYRPGGGPGRVRGSEGTDLTAACREDSRGRRGCNQANRQEGMCLGTVCVGCGVVGFAQVRRRSTRALHTGMLSFRPSPDCEDRCGCGWGCG